MTLRDFRKLTANLPEDTVIVIKGPGEYEPAKVFGGFEIVPAIVSPDGEDIKVHYTMADVEGESEEEEGYKDTLVIALDASD